MTRMLSIILSMGATIFSAKNVVEASFVKKCLSFITVYSLEGVRRNVLRHLAVDLTYASNMLLKPKQVIC